MFPGCAYGVALLVIITMGVIVVRFMRELSRLLLGKKALSVCVQAQVPDVLRALRFDRDHALSRGWWPRRR